MLALLVAGMGLLPRECHAASDLFGAGAWRRFARIALRLPRPSLPTAPIHGT